MRLLLPSSFRSTASPRQVCFFKSMAQLRDGKPYLSHLDRTAAELREKQLRAVTLAGIDQVNESIRLLRLELEDAVSGVSFNAGQWLDVFVPDDSVKKPGGFTVTSPPALALPNNRSGHVPFLELAIQHSPRNPPAAWLWQPPSKILGKQLNVRFGGSFTLPQTTQNLAKIVMVAGGVGINPLMAMLSHLSQQNGIQWPYSVSLLYACKPAQDASAILFLPRLLALVPPLDLHIFFGDNSASAQLPSTLPDNVAMYRRRMSLEDVESKHVEDRDRASANTIFYVCGPQKMTDDFVEGIRGLEGVAPDNVLCEKWW